MSVRPPRSLSVLHRGQDVEAYRPIPKVEIHCHLLGAVAAGTVIDLARKALNQQ